MEQSITAWQLLGLSQGHSVLCLDAPTDARCFGWWYLREKLVILDTYTVASIVINLAIAALSPAIRIRAFAIPCLSISAFRPIARAVSQITGACRGHLTHYSQVSHDNLCRTTHARPNDEHPVPLETSRMPANIQPGPDGPVQLLIS